jgi:DNA-binding response OmpR family regulator
MRRTGGRAPLGVAQAKRRLDGCTILLVEDEPLISLELKHILEEAGAKVLSANGAKSAHSLIDTFDLSGAVLDWIDADICRRLIERSVPFVFYSGHTADTFEAWQHVPVVSKPAFPEDIVTALTAALAAAGDAR